MTYRIEQYGSPDEIAEIIRQTDDESRIRYRLLDYPLLPAPEEKKNIFIYLATCLLSFKMKLSCMNADCIK